MIKMLKRFQLPVEVKKKKSDFIIKNNFKNNFVKKNVKNILKEILINVWSNTWHRDNRTINNRAT